MKKENKFLQWLKRPHGCFLVLIYLSTIAAIGASAILAVLGHTDGVLSYISYIVFAVAALLLGYTVYTIVIYAPDIKRKIIEKLKSKTFTANLIENYGFRTTVFAFVSFCITVAFAVMNLVSAVRYRSIWYGAIAAYYFVLILFRGGIMLADVKCKKKSAQDESAYEKSKWKIHLASGAFLMFLEIAMAAAVTQMMLSERPVQSGKIMAIASAAYAFYKMIMAIYNLIKAKRYRNPITQSLRNLNFADACMSIVSLTVLMISTFDGDASGSAMTYVKASVGFAACAAVIAMATVMIVRAHKKLAEFEKGDAEQK